MNKTYKNTLITLIAFAIYFVIDDLIFRDLRNWFYDLTNQYGLSHILTYAITGIPLYIGTYLINRNTPILESLGLKKSIGMGFVFALLCTLPMFIGYGILFDLNTELSINTILIGVVAAGFFEELFFRGFLFGQLFRNTTLGFIPSVLFGALFFGSLHLYQSTDMVELTGIFLITFLGGILFAWTYVEWNYSLWVPIFLHMLMNLAWELFSVSTNALGDVYANVFRILTIALIIILTILYKKGKKLPLTINKNNLWVQKQAEPNTQVE